MKLIKLFETTDKDEYWYCPENNELFVRNQVYGEEWSHSKDFVEYGCKIKLANNEEEDIDW